MKRLEIRKLKRAVVDEGNKNAMLTLLERSVLFGHKKLALIRCIQAERLGITISKDILSYCQDVADSLPAKVLQKLLRQASFKRDTLH